MLMVDNVNANLMSLADVVTSVLLEPMALGPQDVQPVTAVPLEPETTSVTQAMANVCACLACMADSVVHVKVVSGVSPTAVLATVTAVLRSVTMGVDSACSAGTTLADITAMNVAEVTMVTPLPILLLAADPACVLEERVVDTNMPKLVNWTSDPTRLLVIVMRDILV